MQETLRCRLHSRSGGLLPFELPDARARYAPDLPYQLEKLSIRIRVEPKEKTFQAETAYELRTVAKELKRVSLDQCGLTFESASVSGNPAPFSVEEGRIHVTPSRPPSFGEKLALVLRYSGGSPRRGLYFTGPDADYPAKPYQVWTQGEDEDNRYWLPCPDYPNQKTLLELTANVPRGFTAVANGALVSRREEGERVIFHYRLSRPLVTYLVSLVVGELAAIETRGPRGIPVQYYFAPGREKDAERAFGRTARMIEAFESKIGVPFPFEKYSQAAVQDFIFGGMENASATTQTDLTLHDERAHLDYSSEPLVSHELAHQWFGDLVTCRDWSHGWLNEGFATFLERVWIESDSGPSGGPEEARYYSYLDLKDYLDESYRRPIVCNRFAVPMDLFDRHLYQKGGLVLNCLRNELGEEAFWASVRRYLERNADSTAETLDLIRAIEETTGRNLRRFFEQWVESPGHPELEASFEWHEDEKLAEIQVKQTQATGKDSAPGFAQGVPLFHLDLAVLLTLADGAEVKGRIALSEHAARAFLPCPSKPIGARIDPDGVIPKTLKFPRPSEMLRWHLTQDPSCLGRIEAAREIAEKPDSAGVSGLATALLADPFWGAQAEIADSLARTRWTEAKDALISGLAGAKHPKARRAIAKALGSFRSEDAFRALARAAASDASYFVEAEATLAAARAAPESMAHALWDLTRAQLEKPSHDDVIRASALRAIGENPEAQRGELPLAVDTLVNWSRRGNSLGARRGAALGLGRLAKNALAPVRKGAIKRLEELADEESFRLRNAIILALEDSALAESAPILEKIRRIDSDGRVRGDAYRVKQGILRSAEPVSGVTDLRKSLERIEEEQNRLRKWVEEKLATLQSHKN